MRRIQLRTSIVITTSMQSNTSRTNVSKKISPESLEFALPSPHHPIVMAIIIHSYCLNNLFKQMMKS
nr:hypothetical transcript [Hymenolepis microstoma]